MTDHSWRDSAACLDQFTDLWFPERGAYTDENRWAQRLCLGCPVRAMCLESALQEPEQIGVRGGLTDNQRTRLLRRTT